MPFIIAAISCSKKTEEVKTSKPLSGRLTADTTNCSDCYGWGPAIGVASISGPTTAAVGQNIQLTAELTGTNGCAKNAELTNTTSGNTTTFGGNIFYCGCMCTQALVDIPDAYSFTPTQSGTYTFQGYTYDSVLVTHTVVVP